MENSSKKINIKLTQEIIDALNNIRGWGSVEIFMQDYKVVQITERNIKKTKGINIEKEKNGHSMFNG